MSEPTPMEPDMARGRTNSPSRETSQPSPAQDLADETQNLVAPVSAEAEEIFNSILVDITGESPADVEEPTPIISDPDISKSVEEEHVGMDDSDGDDTSSSEERPVKRQRLSEESAERNKAGPSKAVEPSDRAAPKVKVKIPPAEELADLEARLSKFDQFAKQRELADWEVWTRGELKARISVLKRNPNNPGPEDESAIQDEGEMKNKKEKKEDANEVNIKTEGTPDRKPAVTPPKKTSTKKTKPALNPAAEFWDKHQAKGTKKRKRNGGTSLLDMVMNGDSAEARAAQGEIELAGSIEATRTRDEAIRKMTGPDPGWGDVTVLKFALQSFGRGQVKPDPEGAMKWKVEGIQTSLYCHQVVGVSLMLKKEFSKQGPKGGILADEMGLGKTLQIITMMRYNRPSKGERKKNRHTTLIVVPASAVRQMMAEIDRHVEHKQEEENPDFDFGNLDDDEEEDGTGFDDVMQYNRRNLDTYDNRWKKADIIVTSYNEIVGALPDKKNMLKIKSRNLPPEVESKEILKKSDPILSKNYYRVVLDEGHAIKNSDSATSKACLLLSAKHKWILSGTPLHNRSEELFPYFKFLGINPGVGPEKLQTGRGKDKANRPQKNQDVPYHANLNEVLEDIMIRRHINDKFLGHEILQVPQNHPAEIITFKLPDAERILFKQLEKRFEEIIEDQKLNGGMNSWRVVGAFILLAITRVRQTISHPYLLEGVIRKVFTFKDFGQLKAQLAAAGDEIPANSQIRKLIELERGKRRDDRSGIKSSPEGSMKSFIDADPLGSAAMQGDDIDEALCGQCKELPDGLITTKCNHIFCQDCLASEVKIKGPKCPECDTDLDETDLSMDFQHDAVESDSQTMVPTKAVIAKKAKGKGKGKGKNRVKDHGEDEQFFQPEIGRQLTMLKAYDGDYDQDDSNKMVDGAKVLAVRDHILKWQNEAPDDKIIAFTQYSGTAAILGRVLAEEDIKFVYFTGELSMARKSSAVAKFFEDSDVKVMIASLKCGGQALNLTCANRVIIIDPWWNAAMEKQAFGRVNRIGQTKETYIAKFVADETIEVDMVALQDMKTEDISKTLKEKHEKSGGKDLSSKLLRGLICLQLGGQLKAAGKKEKICFGKKK